LWIPDAAELPTWLSQWRVDLVEGNHDLEELQNERAEGGKTIRGLMRELQDIGDLEFAGSESADEIDDPVGKLIEAQPDHFQIC
jgi:hypothetical protein